MFNKKKKAQATPTEDVQLKPDLTAINGRILQFMQNLSRSNNNFNTNIDTMIQLLQANLQQNQQLMQKMNEITREINNISIAIDSVSSELNRR